MFVGEDAPRRAGRNGKRELGEEATQGIGAWNREDDRKCDCQLNTTLRLPRCPAASNRSDARAAPTERTNKHNDDYSMQRGTIKWFDTEKGFGFIEPEEGGEDVFLHVSNITGSTGGDDMREGQSVAFETERTEKGLSALNASPVG